MSRLRLLLGLMVLLLLAACDTGAPATPVPPSPTAAPVPATATTLPPTDTVAAPTATVPAPTATTVAAAPPTDTAAPPTDTAAAPATGTVEAVQPTPIGTIVGDTFVIPTVAPTVPIQPVLLAVTPAAGRIDVAAEVAAFFKEFYDARTFAKDASSFDLVERSRALTDEPYRDYTITLLQKDADAFDAGLLVNTTYSAVSTSVEQWTPGANGTGTAIVAVTRTRTDTRKGIAPSSATANLRFKLERRPQPDGDAQAVSWVAVDFFNPATNSWVSANVPPATADIAKEIDAFFKNDFYPARSLAPGGKFNIEKTLEITAFAYQDYTIPLLQKQQDEANQGKVTRVTYTDIKTEVVSWFPQQTSHGGVATVKVTRTSNVTRPGGADPPQTATYQFRVHRHWDETGKGLWIAVDFLSPITNKWVSESAGLGGPVPATGHG